MTHRIGKETFCKISFTSNCKKNTSRRWVIKPSLGGKNDLSCANEEVFSIQKKSPFFKFSFPFLRASKACIINICDRVLILFMTFFNLCLSRKCLPKNTRAGLFKLICHMCKCMLWKYLSGKSFHLSICDQTQSYLSSLSLHFFLPPPPCSL